MYIGKLFLFITLLIFLILLGCNNKKEFEYSEDGLIRREFYKDGSLKSEGLYKNDSIKHGWYKEFYNNGNLKSKAEFKDGLMDGLYIYYTKDGIIESKGYFQKDLPHGKTYWYYADGKIKSESFWVEGKEYGELKLFYPNGYLEKYIVRDSYGDILYIMKWDTTGILIKNEGITMSPHFVANYTSDGTIINGNVILAGKEIEVEITVAEPPNSKTVIYIGDLDKGEITNLKEYPIKNNRVLCYRIYNEPGEYTLVTIGSINNNLNQEIKKDTIYTDIKVVVN